ncbi:MAG: BREX-4 system phosphatase PglZ [Bacteroidaceae bacterium]|nr:BREX-4 system phosphatase PglZ [Bacteroidaceae bacterium]
MYKEAFTEMAALKAYVRDDKEATGLGAATRNRYPIRFVLFDNFRDCYDFVEFLQTEPGAHVESVDHWIDGDYPDLLITHVELAERIAEHIAGKSPNDCVIAPFSELARFYENDEKKAFDALIKTIKAIQASPEAQKNHQRVYIPLVGLEGKMEVFKDDSQIHIWRLVSEDKDLTYRLVLTDGEDFGVKGLEASHTVVNNIREWLNIWKDNERQVSPQIICTSRAIFANARYAQPDNAFSYQVCHTAYEFLTAGLGLNFGNIRPSESDGDNWDLLAESIDVAGGFSFKKFVRQYFSIDDIASHEDFIRLWFDHPYIFNRWLLARFYTDQEHADGYLCRCLEATTSYGTNELIERMAGDITEIAQEMAVRKYCLTYAAQRQVRLSDAAESMVARALQNLPDKMGYAGALKYFTGITRKEKEFAVSWLGQGLITPADVQAFYPDLYAYLSEDIGIGASADMPHWVGDYIGQYKKAKIANRYTPDIKRLIDELNGSESAFDGWYNTFRSTYTLLKDRSDIEVFYWIDGLGIDWIPLVKSIVGERKDQQVFLNEIKIARALLPTKTETNKNDLLRLLPEGAQLEKSGDLDSLAHRSDNISPFTMIKEIEVVRRSVEEILQKYSGKKIAIVSDHGLTYLSQMVGGKNLAGVESDHHGRIAVRQQAGSGADSSYFRLDERTLCALKHESLCGKVPSGQGAHGGCTPEEVLVPVFIISSVATRAEWTFSLLTPELSGANARLRFEIKNMPPADIPYIIYNGVKYVAHVVSTDIYETDEIMVDAHVTDFTLVLGDTSRTMKVKVTTGVQEEDLFDF